MKYTTKTSNVVVSGGVGFPTLLFLLFLGLKLTNYINWAWIWIISPLWIPVVIILIIFIVLILGSVISLLINRSKNKKLNNMYGQKRYRK